MGLFDFARRKREDEDPFESEVRNLVGSLGPFDALEYDQAVRLATDVLMNSILSLHEAFTAGCPRPRIAPSKFRASLERRIAEVAAWVRPQPQARVSDVGQRIAEVCFGSLGERPYLDTNEIPWLVGVSHGLAHELWETDRDIAKRLIDPRAHEKSDAQGLTPLEEDLVGRLVRYGQTDDERMVEEILPVYQRALVELTTEQRSNMLLWLIEQVEGRRLSGNALMPFLFNDTDWHVISTASLHMAALWPQSDDDPLIGVREIAGWARRFARQGDEERATALFAGLALLGDRRILDCIGPCWRVLSPEMRGRLAKGVAGRSYAGLIDWLLTWLEECEGAEFGAVAGTLSRVPSVTTPAEVIEVRRALPVWSVAPDQVITVLQRWSFEAYGQQIRKRLLQVAADEVAPRVMHDVLKCWKISHVERQAAGVHMRARAGTESPRALLPLLGNRPLSRSEVLQSFIRLDDDDFVARDGRLLLCWALFNPYGPTWSSVGLLPTEDPEIELLFYRMLNPFGQQSALVGVVLRSEGDETVVVSRLAEELFAREVMPSEDGSDELFLIGNGVPDVRYVVWNDAKFAAVADRAFRTTPRLRELDVVRAVREIREFSGRPWDRTAAQREAALKRMTPEGLITPLPHEGTTTESVINEWLTLVSQQEHWVPELVNFPGAWHGAIDHVSAELGQNAYTFWQLDDFLARYGFSVFRELAEMLERNQDGDPTPADASDAKPASNVDEGTGDANSYRAAYTRIRKGWEGLDLESEPPSKAARGIAVGMIARQMASAEHHLASVSVDTRAIRRLMHRPWALGYLLGAGHAMNEVHKLTSGSHDAESVITAAHQSGILNITTAEIIDLSNRARERPGFEDGMIAAAQDVIAAMGGDGEADGLFRWLMEEGTQNTT